MIGLEIADLFCGAGGTSQGAIEAAEAVGFLPRLTAINHWDRAIATHKANHPTARHLCTGIDSVDPRKLYKSGELDVLWASPECTHHSVARGGKPINDQSRATAMCVPRWAEALRPRLILVENVPEFQTWGPCDSKGKPIKARKGEIFRAWVGMLEAIGYRVEWRVLTAADYGDPTTRRRLFVQAILGRSKIVWPEPTHSKAASDELLGRLPWVAAREIIDWALPSQSIYERKRPLSPKTMNRIFAGLKKFGLKPFVVQNAHGNDDRTGDIRRSYPLEMPLKAVSGSNEYCLTEPFLLDGFGERKGQKIRARSVKKPLATVTAQKGGPSLVEPLILSAGGPECPARPVSEPMGTVPTRDHRALAEPFLICMEHKGSIRSVKRPMPTVTTAKGGAIGVAEPMIIPQRSNAPARSVDKPAPTVTTTSRGVGLAEAFIISTAHAGERKARGVDKPLTTVAGNRGEQALVESALLPQGQGGALRPVSEPVPTVATDGAIGVVEPYLVKYYGTGHGAASVKDPLATVTAQDRFGIVRPIVVIDGERYLLDILFRMLQPHELAGAQGFRKDYKFTGTKAEQVKQIGNAVPRRLARAIVAGALSQKADVREYMKEAA